MPAKRSPPGPAGPVSVGDRIEGFLAFDGRKRGLVTDTIGLPVAVDVHPADIQDRDGAVPLLTSMRSSWPWRRHVFADGGFAGDKLVNALVGQGKWTIEIVRRSAEAEGFEVLPRPLRGLLAASLPGIGSRASWPLMGGRANAGMAQSEQAAGKGFRGKHRERQGLAAACLHQATYATAGQIVINLSDCESGSQRMPLPQQQQLCISRNRIGRAILRLAATFANSPPTDRSRQANPTWTVAAGQTPRPDYPAQSQSGCRAPTKPIQRIKAEAWRSCKGLAWPNR